MRFWDILSNCVIWSHYHKKLGYKKQSPINIIIIIIFSDVEIGFHFKKEKSILHIVNYAEY